jgi:CRP-like cAMP-binding protein
MVRYRRLSAVSLCTRDEAQVRGAIAFAPMAEDISGDGLRERLTRQGEDALGRIAQDLLENPLINGAIARAFEAREKAAQAQEVALGALNLPSASDIERLTRRVRSLSQRLEGIEDGVDRLDERLAALQASLDGVAKELAALRKAAPVKAAAKRSSGSKTTAPRST